MRIITEIEPYQQDPETVYFNNIDMDQRFACDGKVWIKKDCLSRIELFTGAMYGANPNSICRPINFDKGDRVIIENGSARVEWAEPEPPTWDDLKVGDVFETEEGTIWHVCAQGICRILNPIAGEWAHGTPAYRNLEFLKAFPIERILGHVKKTYIKD